MEDLQTLLQIESSIKEGRETLTFSFTSREKIVVVASDAISIIQAHTDCGSE
jgi:hypothetical protein